MNQGLLNVIMNFIEFSIETRTSHKESHQQKL